MVVPILCLVCLFLLVWVIVLKCQIEELKRDDAAPRPRRRSDPPPQNTTVRGMRKFDVD